MVEEVRAIEPNTYFGVASFVDKPISPFGGSSDYVYRTDLPLTPDADLLQETIDNLMVRGGSDGSKSQVEALFQLALRPNEIGFRNSRRVVVLTTDASFHIAGDGERIGITTPNNGDTVLDGSIVGG